MNLAQLVPIALSVSIALIVFSVALQTPPGSVAPLLKQPGLILRSLLAMNVVMPLLAAGVAAAFRLHPAVELGLILLAVSPVPPVLPVKQMKAGGSAPYALGLLIISALAALVTVPLSISLIGRLFGHEIAVPVATVAKVVGMSILLPLLAGMIVRRLAPAFAERSAKGISKVGVIVLLIGAGLILVASWRGVLALFGNFTVVAIVLFLVAGLAVGHLLGGPDSDDRTVLALSTAVRHPGVAMAVATAILPPEQKGAVAAVILLNLVVGAIVTGPYVKWRKRVHAPAPLPAVP
jgi:BASS family bile acid:Na+ symporter